MPVHRFRRPPARAWSGWLMVAVLTVAAVVLHGERSARSQQPTQGGATADGVGELDVRLGGQVYALQCAACHGTEGDGQPGAGRYAGPPLNDVEVAYVDLTLRTGRMPLLAQDLGIDDRLADQEREAVVAWMQETFDLPGSVPRVGPGSVGRGQELYTRACAACHGSTGHGGVSAGGTLVRPVRGVDRIAVAEAVRVGPFQMPAFDPGVLNDQDVADVAAYIESMEAQPTTPLGVGEIDRVQMAGFALVLALGMLGVVLLVARPVQTAQGAETPPDEPAPGAGG